MEYSEAASKWYGKVPQIQREITERHRDFNPNDVGDHRKSMEKVGVVWRDLTKHDRYLEKFYKTHHYLGFGKGGWVPNDEGEEE